MAKHSIPQKQHKIKYSRSRSRRKYSAQYGGMTSVAKAWNALAIPTLMITLGIVKNGLDAASLLLLYVIRILSGKKSIADFLKEGDDPLLMQLTGLGCVAPSTITKLLCHERFLLQNLQETVVSKVTAVLIKHCSNGILVVDNTIISKTGKNHQYARKLKDSASGQYIIGYDMVSLHFKYNGISYPLMFEFALGKEYATRIEIACAFI